MSAPVFVLWGYHPRVLPEPYPIRLTGGNVGHCRAEGRERVAQGWLTQIYPEGARPVGLAARVVTAYGQPSPAFLAAIAPTSSPSTSDEE